MLDAPCRAQAQLRLLEDFGVPTMEWTLAPTRRDVRALFSTWDTQRILLKPSFTYGGKGVRVFIRNAVWRLRWKRDLDVFCREVNPDDGNVYKPELLNGRVLISWKSGAPPIRTLFRGGIHRGLRGAYGERSLYELPSHLTNKLKAYCRRARSCECGPNATSRWRARRDRAQPAWRCDMVDQPVPAFPGSLHRGNL
jgi:hypothetical protein